MNLKNPNNKDHRLMLVKYRHRGSGNTRMRLLTCDTFDVRLDFSLPFKSLWRFRVVGTCNGLVCLYDITNCHGGGGRRIIVCNPYLNEHKIIPQRTLYLPEKEDLIHNVSGFCYDFIKNEYKVVWLGAPKDEEGKGYSSIFQVYTLGTNSWRIVGLLDINIFYWERRAFVNGAMHWLGVKNNKRCVVSFDVSREVFKLLPSPDCFAAEGYYGYNRIEVYKDLLCVVNWMNRARFDIWVMVDYGVEGSWTILYAIKYPQLCVNPQILGFGVKGEFFLDLHGKLIVYYPNHEFKEIVDLAKRVHFLGALNYTENLVSLENA